MSKSFLSNQTPAVPAIWARSWTSEVFVRQRENTAYRMEKKKYHLFTWQRVSMRDIWRIINLSTIKANHSVNTWTEETKNTVRKRIPNWILKNVKRKAVNTVSHQGRANLHRWDSTPPSQKSYCKEMEQTLGANAGEVARSLSGRKFLMCFLWGWSHEWNGLKL